MDAANIRETWSRLEEQVGRVMVGQEDTLRLLGVALFSRGHVLLEGNPGTGKTMLARSFAASLGLLFRRIQFTPDLMPGDVIGTNLFDFQTNRFSLVKGPIFTEFLLADEINRTPPKTQAALLEAMEERQVTLDGQRQPLPETFFVIATQNPVEYEGTYPLPEAQADRFLMKVKIDYPAAAEEVEIRRRAAAGLDVHDLAAAGVAPVISREELAALRGAARSLPVAPEVLEYVSRLVRASRGLPRARLGASPRAGVGLLAAARSRAALAGAAWVSPEDVKAMAPPVLRHRFLLRPEAELEGASPDDLVQELLDSVEVPR